MALKFEIECAGQVTDQPVKLFLMATGAGRDVALKVKKGEREYFLLTVSGSTGRVALHPSIPASFGFDLDTIGRIKTSAI